MEKNALIKKVENLSEAEKLDLFKVEELETRLEQLIIAPIDGACDGLDAGCFEDAACGGVDGGCVDGVCTSVDDTCNGACDSGCGGW